MDILAALSNSRAERGPRRCDLGAWLDAIPAETDGRDELIRLTETPFDRKRDDTMSGSRLSLVLAKLGHDVTQNPLLDHRHHRCRCYR